MNKFQQGIEDAKNRAKMAVAATRERIAWLVEKMTPKRDEAAKKRISGRSRVSGFDKFVNSVFLFVTWAAFLMFLAASLPHVAYFFASFEPVDAAGNVSEWNWWIAYGIAGTIDVTEFLLSIKFARRLKQVTAGLPWYEKIAPAFVTILSYWPFLLLIAGFSWVANFEHAKEFQSGFMLSVADTVKVNLILWQGTLQDLNPVLASAFPVLSVAYTFMMDTMPHESEAVTVTKPITDLQVAEQAPASVTANEFGMLLQAMQDMNARQLQVMQEMQTKQLEVTVKTIKALAAGPSPTPRPRLVRGGGKISEKGVTGDSQYKEPIYQLYLQNKNITGAEAGRKAGCSHVTAGRILKELRGVTVTEVKEGEDERNTEELSVTHSETA